MALLVRSQRLDPEWPAPSLARASLAPLRVLWLVRPGDVDYAAIRRVFSASIALVDTVLARHPGDAVALAERGRLRLRSVVMGHARLQDAAPLADSARRDLEAALAADSTLVRAAADLSELLHAQERFSEGALYAERAYRMDAFLEDASAIIYRLAMSHLEMENDAAALQWCGEGVRRFPENPSHYGCALEVMAWGNGLANADSAWKYFRALASRIGPWNVSARATYQAAVAGILARSAGVPADSARAVLARAGAELDAAPGSSVALRDAAAALEAAVLYRLGDRGAADRLFSQVRQRDSVLATRLALRRPLRNYVGRPRDPGP
jgi:hypothetical protein